jgi:hypothetical protein
MGKIDPACLTSTPDASTLYAFDITISVDQTLTDFSSADSFIIIKSNANPISPNSLSWTVSSRVNMDDLSFSVIGGNYACAVSNEGVFTISMRRSSSTNNIKSESYGFRYDPNGKSGSGSVPGNNGRGSWTPIKFEKYDWPVNYDIQLLEYVNGPTGLQLVHCHKIPNTVKCATYNDETNTLVGTWTWDFVSRCSHFFPFSRCFNFSGSFF